MAGKYRDATRALNQPARLLLRSGFLFTIIENLEGFELISHYHYIGFSGCRSVCKLQINRKLHIVIATQVAENDGTSITNYAEQLATRVCQEFGINPAKLIWIENYGRDSEYTEEHFQRFRKGKEEYDLVTFAWTGERFLSPTWQRLQPGELATILQADT